MTFKYERAEGVLSIEPDTIDEAIQLGLIIQRLWDANVKVSLCDGRRVAVAVKRQPGDLPKEGS
jgi:hypothetical protein